MKWLLIPFAALFVAWLAIAALMFVTQRSLLYLPSQRAVPADRAEALGLTRWPDPEDARGYLYEPPVAVPAERATVVVFHGNAGQAIDRTNYLEALGEWRARVLLAEYPGYGERAGSPSESLLAADARETLQLARERFADGPLYVVGESLGAAVAAAAIGSDQMAAPSPAVDGLVLLTPWDTLTALAGHHYRFLPVRWLLRDRWESARWLADLDAPSAVVIAERDEIVPPQFGRALFDGLPEPKTLRVVEAARHNDWIGRVDAAWWSALLESLQARGD